MTIIEKIKAALWINRTINEASEVKKGMEKPGWKTTEFWLTLVTTAWTMFGGMVPEPYNAILATVITSIYTAARTAGKVKATEQTQVNVKNSEVTVEATKATSVASP